MGAEPMEVGYSWLLAEIDWNEALSSLNINRVYFSPDPHFALRQTPKTTKSHQGDVSRRDAFTSIH